MITTGGAERFALGLATNLPSERFELWVCSTRTAEPAALELLANAGVRHVNLGRRAKLDVYRLWGLVRLLRTHRFDVLHAHMFGSNLWGTVIGRLCRVPVIVAHEQTWSYEGEPLRRWLDGHVIGRWATRFIAVSTRDAERMVTIEGVSPAKVTMIPNGYVPRPTSADTNLRRELGTPPDAPLLVVVAQLRPQKALSVLLEAFVTVRAAIPDVHLVIAGDGECRLALEQQASATGISQAVHFLGRRDDVDGILRCGDIAVMSSDFEGTPLVAYECIANRTPLVATAVGGLPDIIVDGETGRLVPRRNPDALAQALIELLRDPALRRRLVEAALRAHPDIGIDTSVGRFSELYEMLIAETGTVLPDALATAAH
ncbi:MAG: glycosyltransferase [Solirubrobacteraceae bacterium]